MNRILLVEDEINVRTPLKDYLNREGFDISEATSLREADLKLSTQPNLILLDWMLPDGQGIELLKKWRSQKVQTPVILLTARAELIDKVLGLELGANDYVTKPFEPRELAARIRVQLRSQTTEPASSLLQVGEILLNTLTFEGTYQSSRIDLTKTEFELLRTFLASPNQVFSREELLKKVWGYDQSPTTRTVDTHVLQLRQKTKAELFETVHGIGYRFRVKS